MSHLWHIPGRTLQSVALWMWSTRWFSRYFCDENCSFIICGGLGGFGLELADWLCLRGCKRLILTSRTGIKTGYQAYRISWVRENGEKSVWSWCLQHMEVLRMCRGGVHGRHNHCGRLLEPDQGGTTSRSCTGHLQPRGCSERLHSGQSNRAILPGLVCSQSLCHKVFGRSVQATLSRAKVLHKITQSKWKLETVTVHRKHLSL